MRSHLKSVSLATATLLLCLGSGAIVPSVRSVAAQTTPDRKAEAEKLLQTGVQQYRQSNFREALATFQQALVLVRQIGDRRREGIMLNNIGLIYDSLGQYPKALEFYQQALAIRKEIGDLKGEGTTLNNIGEVYRSLGQYPKALEFFNKPW